MSYLEEKGNPMVVTKSGITVQLDDYTYQYGLSEKEALSQVTIVPDICTCNGEYNSDECNCPGECEDCYIQFCLDEFYYTPKPYCHVVLLRNLGLRLNTLYFLMGTEGLQ